MEYQKELIKQIEEKKKEIEKLKEKVCLRLANINLLNFIIFIILFYFIGTS